MTRISIDLRSGDLVNQYSDMIVGIDLGTTNSIVAYVKGEETVAVKDKNDNRTLVPSVVHFDESGNILVGKEALDMLVNDPANTIYSVKRLLGKSYADVRAEHAYFGYEVIDDGSDNLVKIKVRNKFYTPTELSAEILKYLKSSAEANLGGSISKAVITVPAYFNDAQRQATRDAGKLAGLDVLRIINEPTAASLAYGLGQKDEQTIAVYDLGGGTFDISILQINDGVFEVLSTNGDTYLGGDDFDRRIVDHWLEKYNLRENPIFNDKSGGQKLRLLAEKAKKALGADEVVEYNLEGAVFSLSKEIFEKLISDLVEKTIESCKLAISDAKISIHDIQHVVMVGGSTRVDLVKRRVSEFFQKPVYDEIDPDEVVALGAAIQADVLAGNQKDVLLLDITPLSLGIETMGGLMDTIIPRNTKVPSKAGRQYTTSVDGQKNLKIAVFQGERDLVEHNRKLGEFILRDIPPMPAGLPKIEVHFIINADGILKVKAKELRSGTEQAIDIKPTYGISEEEMGLMLMDSIKNAKNDMQVRAVLEAKNEANHIILSTDKFLKQNESILSEEESSKIRSLRAALQTAAAGDDKDLINNTMQELNEFSAPIANRVMDIAIQKAMRGQKI